MAGTGMERNSLTLWTSSQKGRLEGPPCSPVLVGSTNLGAVKEDAEVSVPYCSCSSTCKGDCSFEDAGTILEGTTVEGVEFGMVVACIGAEEGTCIWDATAWTDWEAMAAEPLTLAKPFLIAGGGWDIVTSMGSSNFVAAGIADMQRGDRDSVRLCNYSLRDRISSSWSQTVKHILHRLL